MSVFYMCDGKAKCSSRDGCYYNKRAQHRFCKTTSNIEHARNFIRRDNGNYIEKEPDIDWDLIDDGR